MKINFFSLLIFNTLFFTLLCNETPKKELSKLVTKLDNIEYKKIEVKLSQLDNCSEKTYLPCNPSICKTEDGYLVVCRTVNYDIDFNRKPMIQTIDSSDSLKTKNILVHYDKNFNKIKETPILDEMDNATHFYKRQGFEDYRIFNWDNQFWFLSTTYDTGAQGIPKKVLGKFKNVESSEDKIELENVTIIDRPCTKWGSKNWLPFIIDNTLAAIYSFDPFTVFQIEKNGTYKAIIQKENFPIDISTFKGSAAPIAFDNGYLTLIHETIVLVDKVNYFHRFVYLDSNLNIQKISDRFTFMEQDIEFVCGMTLDNLTNKLVVGLGVWDKEAYLCFIDTSYINSLLKSLDS